MEATGVYWVVLYDILDRAGMDVWVVNGWAVKQVPGRKTDVQDCQWLRQLHSYCQKAKHQETASPAKVQKHHKLQINNLHEQILLLTDGSDVTRLPGITDYNTLRILAETGSDLSHWPTEKHFVSWLGLAPALNSSGNTIKKKNIHKTTSAGQIFREAAHSLLISKYNALGAFGRRIRSRKGPFIAIKALARKLACMFYKVLTKGWQFVELGISEYKRKYEEVLLKNLNKQAKALKCQLVPVNP